MANSLVCELPDQRTFGTKHSRLIRRNGNHTIVVAEILNHYLAILMTTYAHYIPETQDEAARLMDEILTPILIDVRDLG